MKKLTKLDTNGFLVGISEDMNEMYETKVTNTESGDKIILFTDGIVEAKNSENEEFGMEVDEVVKMFRDVKCKPCPGLKSKPDCKIAHDHGCPKPKKP